MLHESEVALVDTLLPVEVLGGVFRVLDMKARCRCAQVNKRWRDVLYATPTLWLNLDLSGRHTLGGEKIAEAASHPSSIEFRVKVLLASGLMVPKERKLTHIIQTTFKPVDPVTLYQSTLSLQSGSTLSLDTHVFLRRFEQLRKLDVSCTSFDPEIFTDPLIAGWLAPTLTHLNMSACTGVNAGSLSYVRVLKNLVSLDVSHCDGMDDLGVEAISMWLPWLRNLNLSYLFKITDASVRRLFRLKNLQTVNLMGCCRIKTYLWAMDEDKKNRPVMPIKEILTGEDSRIQTRGFWLLWCTWQAWNMSKFVTVVPFLETLRLNMVLLDFPADGLEILMNNCTKLKHLAIVADRTIITALCGVAQKLRRLDVLELTIHIGVSGEHIQSLITAEALPKLKAIKFHSKHSTVFTDSIISQLAKQANTLEYLELNGEALSPGFLTPIAETLRGSIQSLLIHHGTLTPASMTSLAKHGKSLRELTMTDIQQQVPAPREKAAAVGVQARCRLSLLVQSGSFLPEKLKKLELSSTSGFCDKDLAKIPEQCPNLQWVDLSFPFTFPKTTMALADNCPNLLYIRLCKSTQSGYSRVTTEQATSSRRESSLHTSTEQHRRSSQSSTNSRSNNSATSPASNVSTTTTTAARRSRSNPRGTSVLQCVSLRSYTSGPFFTSLQRASIGGGSGGSSSPSSSPRASTTTRPQGNNRTSRTSHSSPTRESITAKTHASESSSPSGPLVTTPPSIATQKTKLKDNTHHHHHPQDLASSPESKALLYLGSSRAATRLRVLDLTGRLGVNDYNLSQGLSKLSKLHTLFLDGVGPRVTAKGVKEFAEVRWKTLKRLHVRNCIGCQLGCVGENYLTRSLEIDLVVDGGRVVTGSRLSDD